jgi:hypothetical protein
MVMEAPQAGSLGLDLDLNKGVHCCEGEEWR